MPTSNSSYLKAAENILNHLKETTLNQKDPSLNILTNILKHCLSFRSSKNKINMIYNRYYKRYEPKYCSLIKSLNFGTNAITSKSNSGMISIHPIVEDHAIYKKLGNYNIKFVEFFTFKPKSLYHNQVYTEIETFINSLKDIARLNQELSQLKNDVIVAKIPSSLKKFLSSSDSLIIEYSKKKNQKTIKRYVSEVFKLDNIQVQSRKLRSYNGFDFVTSTKDKTHNELISYLIAKDITTFQEDIVRSTKESLSSWIQENVKLISNSTPEQIYNSLHP